MNKKVDKKNIANNKIEEKKFQKKLYESCNTESSLIALPTGVGKTVVSILISSDRLEKGDILFMAPSKPLVEQQHESYCEFLSIDDSKISMLNGNISPDKREKIWNNSRVIVSTPQVVKNDLIRGKVKLEDFSHLVFDECHKAKGDYSYNFIADKYKDEVGIVTGLSASPGSDKQEILNVCENLGISNIEVITSDSDLLKNETNEVEVNEVWIELDEETKECKELVEDFYTDLLTRLKENNVLNSRSKSIPMYKIKKAQGKVKNKISQGNAESKDYKSLSYLAQAMKLNHCLEVIESQGLSVFASYVDSIDRDSKASKRILDDKRFKDAFKIAEEYDRLNPKKSHLNSILIDKVSDDKQVIVFSQYRETTEMITEMLGEYDGLSAHKFVGQSNKNNSRGMSQNKQKEIIEEFKMGEYDVLVATSVAEEGLDLPQVDCLIMYEPVPSGIRSIQRKGRTGREDFGEIYILIAKNTRDVGYYYSAKNKKENMENTLEDLKEIDDELNNELKNNQNQKDITDYVGSEKLKIIADSREMSSSVIEELDEKVNLKIETLEIGDYVLSNECAIERKSVEDLLSTIKGDRSLFGQAKELSNEYSKPVYLIEGNIERLYSDNINENSIRGMLSSLTVDYNIHILWSRNSEESAVLIKNMAKREQEDEKDSSFSSHGNKKVKSERENIKYVVSSIKGVGPETGNKLLERFGNINNISNSSKEELKEVEGVGEKTAETVLKILNKNIEEAEKRRT